VTGRCHVVVGGGNSTLCLIDGGALKGESWLCCVWRRRSDGSVRIKVEKANSLDFLLWEN
jgi:hypothetical protein